MFKVTIVAFSSGSSTFTIFDCSGGISGLTASYLLNKKHNITLFEKNDYLGGHTHTHDITIGEKNFSVDSGFIVYNEKTYPNFIKLLT